LPFGRRAWEAIVVAENPLRRTRLVTLGFLTWGAAALACLAAVALTWGKPTEAFLASAVGQWKYDIGPTILAWLAADLLLAGGVSFLVAGLSRRSRSTG
jgi:hypothetical protein